VHMLNESNLGAFSVMRPAAPDRRLRAVSLPDITRTPPSRPSEQQLGRSLVYGSAAMGRLSGMVQRIAPRDVTVLITGESGTGKELVADALVELSTRSTRPYIRFNCAALTAELAEAELFGHSRGAFTGAVRARAGLFREANGGTILLDEIGELPALLQAKLLRVLQEGEVRPVGEERPVDIDVRVVAATHRDLRRMVAEGTFREDLYYRLNVVQLNVPALRDRPDDVPLLASRFLADAARRFGVGPFPMTPALIDRLLAYHWPGNVRELHNAIESLVALSLGDQLDLTLLPEAPDLAPPLRSREPPIELGISQEAGTLKARVDEFERALILEALRHARGNTSAAARLLGVKRPTLQDKVLKHRLTSQDDDDAGSDARQPKREGRPAFAVCADRELTAVPPYDGTADRQPHAEPVRLRRVEGFK
jgi:two-component system response regulator HydG